MRADQWFAHRLINSDFFQDYFLGLDWRYVGEYVKHWGVCMPMVAAAVLLNSWWHAPAVVVYRIELIDG